jgi:lipid-A-disaccharide synthase-like uncharacterized protein
LLPLATGHLSPIANRQSPIANRQSPIANRQSPIANRQSPIANRVSRVDSIASSDNTVRMHSVLIDILGVQVTGWKIIGYLGALGFSARWFIQLWASKKAGKPVVPLIFWILSMVASLSCLLYFIFGKNDSVGVLSNIFPCGIAVYNLYLELAHRRTPIPDPIEKEVPLS